MGFQTPGTRLSRLLLCTLVLVECPLSPRGAVSTSAGFAMRDDVASSSSDDGTAERTLKVACESNSECVRGTICVDCVCMCNPLRGHAGANCEMMTGASWVLAAVLVGVVYVSVHIMSAVAKRSSKNPSKTCSGLVEIASIFTRQSGKDSASTTTRVVIVAFILEICSHIWSILATVKVVSERTAEFWDTRIFFPLSEGAYVLPSAIVISVWMQVADTSVSRYQTRKRLSRTSTLLQAATMLVMGLLFVLCELGQLEWAMVLNLIVLGIGLFTCGGGAAKLCNSLRAANESNGKAMADTVFKVSRLMGCCFYVIFIGNSMVLASRTRKSHPVNLAVLGMTLSSFSKCFLQKVIFEYLRASTRAKRDRPSARTLLRSPERVLTSIRRMVRSVAERKARTHAIKNDVNVDDSGEAHSQPPPLSENETASRREPATVSPGRISGSAARFQGRKSSAICPTEEAMGTEVTFPDVSPDPMIGEARGPCVRQDEGDNGPGNCVRAAGADDRHAQRCEVTTLESPHGIDVASSGDDITSRSVGDNDHYHRDDFDASRGTIQREPDCITSPCGRGRHHLSNSQIVADSDHLRCERFSSNVVDSLYGGTACTEQDDRLTSRETAVLPVIRLGHLEAPPTRSSPGTTSN